MQTVAGWAARFTLLAALWLLPLRAQAVVTLDSGVPGPRVAVVGGIHGDELSGAEAAKLLAKGPPPRRGVLVLVPEADPAALAAGVRYRDRDLNRSFPGVEGSAAAAIFTAVREADLVLDLHEAGVAWTEGDRPALVVSPAAAGFALELLEKLDARGLRFAFTGGAPAGSLVGELGSQERKALGVEVPARFPMGERVRLHQCAVEAALGLLGMR